MTLAINNILLFPESSNQKTGDVIQSYSPERFCPTSCPFKGNGCYAESYHTLRVWRRADNPEDKRRVHGGEEGLAYALLSAVLAKRAKGDITTQLFRHNVAGDMAVSGTAKLDVVTLMGLARAVQKVNKSLTGNALLGYTYTHCDLTQKDYGYIRQAQSMGFNVNVSCETIEEAIKAKAQGCSVFLACDNVEATKEQLKAKGYHSLQCPSQTHGKSCKSCQLCAKNIKPIILIEVHGQSKAKAKKVIMMKRA